ncbi:hypothetical protein C8F01DRAFT_1369233 [Mycena amicta]|nr:hypothetical protein C8F01DRAFT_1369233 [Mycena amicta]
MSLPTPASAPAPAMDLLDIAITLLLVHVGIEHLHSTGAQVHVGVEHLHSASAYTQFRTPAGLWCLALCVVLASLKPLHRFYRARTLRGRVSRLREEIERTALLLRLHLRKSPHFQTEMEWIDHKWKLLQSMKTLQQIDADVAKMKRKSLIHQLFSRRQVFRNVTDCARQVEEGQDAIRLTIEMAGLKEEIGRLRSLSAVTLVPQAQNEHFNHCAEKFESAV